MAESPADRIELLSSINLVERYELANEVRALEAENARYKYTPQAYDEMWKRVKEAVNENDELKAENAELRKEVQKQETLKNWARVDAEEEEKECDKLKAELEKSINNQETDSN